MGEFSIAHMLILAAILLVFFGPSRLPALGQSLGKAIRGFKEGINEINADAKDVGPQKELNTQETAAKTAEKETNKHKS